MDTQEIVEPATVETEELTQEVETEVAVVEEEIPTTPEEADKPAEPAAEPKKVDGVQKRIDRSVAKQREAEREADYLRGQLAAMKKDVIPTPKEEVKSLSIDDFDTDEAYYAEKSKRDTDKAIKAAFAERDKNDQLVQERVATKSAEEKWDKTVLDFAADNPDFWDVAATAPRSQAMNEAVMVSENGAAIAYYLGNNHDESARIKALSPYAAVMEIGKLSQKLNGPIPKKVTNAPKPHTPVGSGSGTVSGKLTDEEWIRKRNEEVYKA